MPLTDIDATGPIVKRAVGSMPAEYKFEGAFRVAIPNLSYYIDQIKIRAPRSSSH